MEPFRQAKVDKLVQRFREAHITGEVIVGVQAFGALTTDMITHYAYGESWGELDKDGFPNLLTRDVKSLLLSCHFRRFLPGIANVMQRLPEKWLMWLNPDIGTFFDLERKITKLCELALDRAASASQPSREKTILDALTASKVPSSLSSTQTS
jgi:hypothetical protein